MILPPLAALAIAKLRRRRIVLIQHEWGGLNWMRRISYIPALLLADTIIMFSSLVRRELADDPLLGWTIRKCVLAPLPPNIEAPARTRDLEIVPAARRGARERAAGDRPFRFDLSGQAAQCAARDRRDILKARGLKPLIVYIGSFIRGVDKVEEDFYARAAELGLAERRDRHRLRRLRREVFGLFSEVDAFCYPLDEGLTARRSSVLTCVQSGRPLIVTGPALPDEFDHHPRFKELIDRGAIVLVPRGSTNEAYADGIVAAHQTATCASRRSISTAGGATSRKR